MVVDDDSSKGSSVWTRKSERRRTSFFFRRSLAARKSRFFATKRLWPKGRKKKCCKFRFGCQVLDKVSLESVLQSGHFCQLEKKVRRRRRHGDRARASIDPPQQLFCPLGITFDVVSTSRQNGGPVLPHCKSCVQKRPSKGQPKVFGYSHWISAQSRIQRLHFLPETLRRSHGRVQRFSNCKRFVPCVSPQPHQIRARVEPRGRCYHLFYLWYYYSIHLAVTSILSGDPSPSLKAKGAASPGQSNKVWSFVEISILAEPRWTSEQTRKTSDSVECDRKGFIEGAVLKNKKNSVVREAPNY